MKDKEALKSEQIIKRIQSGNRGTWAEEAVKDIAFINSVQWEDDISKRAEAENKSTPTINEMKPARDQVVSMLTSNPPRFHAIGRENSDAKTASHVADLFSYIWSNSKGNVKIKKGCEDFEDVGVGALMAYVNPHADYGKGEIMIADVNPLNLYISNSQDSDTQDAVHKIIRKFPTREEVELLVPNFNFKEAQQSSNDEIPQSGLKATENQIFEDENSEYSEGAERYEYLDRYTKVKHKIYHVEDLEGVLEKTFETAQEYIEWSRNYAIIVTKVNSPVRYIVRDQDVQEILSMINQYGSVIHYIENPMTGEPMPMPGVEGYYEGTIPGSTTQFEVTTMADLTNIGALKTSQPKVDRIRRVASIGGKVIYDNVMPISRHPIVTFMLHHKRDPYPYGDARLTRPYQEEINKLDQLVITYLTNITNLSLIVPKGGKLKKQILEEAGKAGLKVLEADFDIDAQPIVIQYPPLPASIFDMRQALIGQIQRIYGAYPFQEGAIVNAPDSGKNTMILDEMGSRRSNSKRSTIEESINELGRVILEMIPFVYNQRKIIRVVSPNHESKVVILNDVKEENGAIEILNDVSVANFDIIVVSGSMMPSNRMGRFDQFEKAYQTGMIRNPKFALREMDIPNVDEVIESEDALVQAQQTISQLEDMVKNLQGDLQTAQRGEVEAEKKVAVQKAVTKLNNTISKVDAQAQIATAKLKDQSKKVETKSQPSNSK